MRIDIANRLAAIRRERGYSQEALAAELGVSRQAVSKWERAESSPDTDNLIALAELYGMTLDQLIREDGTVLEVAADTGEPASFSDAPASEDSATPNPDAADKPCEEQAATDSQEHRIGEHVEISWHGIHVIDKDGCEVYVGPGGIHVNEPKSGGHGIVADGGITINGVHYGSLREANEAWGHGVRSGGPVDIAVIALAIAALLVAGFVTPWGWGWAVCCLLVIPLWSGVSGVVRADSGPKRRHAIRGLWTMALVAAFLVLGLGYGLWHPGWAVLLLIPVGQLVMSAVWGSKVAAGVPEGEAEERSASA